MHLAVWTAIWLLWTPQTWGQADAASTDQQLGLRQTRPATVALTGARVYLSPDRVVEDATLVIEDGRVVSVTAGGAVPDGARALPLDGATIYPGFVDPYSDYGLPPVPKNERGGNGAPRYEGERRGLESWNDAVHAEARWIDEFAADSETAERLLALGFTSVQTGRKDGVFRGRGLVTTLADATPAEAVLSPTGLHFASFDPGSSEQEYPSSLMGSIALVRQTLLDADWYRRSRGDGAEPNLALAALADNDDPIVFETSGVLSLLRARRIAEEMDVELVHVGSGDEYQVLEDLADLDQPLILPASLPKEPEVGSWEQALDVDLATLRHWERAPGNAAALAEAGIEFAFTSSGLREDEKFFDNLRAMVEAGLATEDAVAALTAVPAAILGLEDEIGSLEEGRRADLVIASGDLFSDEKAKVAAVWIGGLPVHEPEPPAEDDYRGRYRLHLAGVDYDVAVEGEARKPRVKIVQSGNDEDDGGDEGDVGEGSRLPAPTPAGAGSAPSRGGDDEQDDGIQVEGAAIEFGRLSFRARLPEGLASVTLIQLGDELHARAALGTAEPAPVEVSRLPPEEAAADDDNETAEDETAAREFVSQVTHPATAFGFSTLPEPEDVLVQGATVWTVEEQGTIETADLLVRNGKIVAVGPDLDVPAGVRVIDGAGKHVTPGMIDEHSHIAIEGGVNEGSNAVTAEVRIGDVVDPTDINIYRNLAGGTTTAQLLHGSANPIGGQAQIIKMRWGQDAEGLKFAAAPPSIKFALGENVKQSNWGDEHTVRYPQTRMGVETLMRDRFLAAREYAERWRAWNEGDGDGLPPRRDLQLEALVEILEAERFVHCHSYVQSEILMLMRLAEELGFRIQTFTHILEGYKVAPEMAAHGAGASTFSDWWAYKFEVYDAIPQNTCLMADAGVVTSINSDSSDLSRRLNTEAGKSVMHCDMAEEEAIKLATLNPALQLKIDDRVGSLAPGKDADFVIWDGHPLSMHSRAEQTWVDGALYFSRERDAELRQQVREERQALIDKVLAKDEKGKKERDEEEDATNGDARTEAEPAVAPERPYTCDDLEDTWHAAH